MKELLWGLFKNTGRIEYYIKYKEEVKKMKRTIEIGKKYRHFKGNLYKVIDIVYDSESNNEEELKKIVVYQALYGDNIKWARPYDMFNSLVDKEKYPDIEQKYRFEEVDD